MEPEKIVVEHSEKIAKSSLYTSKGEEIEGVAKKLGIKVGEVGKGDLEKVRRILSKGEPRSKIVIYKCQVKTFLRWVRMQMI
jgi:hypothetical protein